MSVNEKDSRNEDFKRNDRLESLLKSLNDNLSLAENNLLENNEYQQAYPLIFIMGAHRSGTTLFLQWLASLNQFSYPSNFLSRFYAAPIIGAKIQKMLIDGRYNFRNEFSDINNHFDFTSDNGKTEGLLAPNEFWYFWRQYLKYNELDYLSDNELQNSFDVAKFKNELLGISAEQSSPLALKGMIMNYNIPFLNKIFDQALFVHIKRDMSSNVESMINARKRQHSDESTWYSFKIKEYPELIGSDFITQCTGQHYYINKAITDGLKNIEDNRKLTIDYEDFCDDPSATYTQLSDKLKLQNFNLNKQYTGELKFKKKIYGATGNTNQINESYNKLIS